jgi:hypothetical protein
MAPQQRPGLVALPNLDHDFFNSSFLSWKRSSLRAVAGELDACPIDLITEYTKLNADRAFRMLSQWERFLVELFKLVAIQRSCAMISAVDAVLQAIDCLPVRPPDWVDPYEGKVDSAAKQASYEAPYKGGDRSIDSAGKGREDLGECRQGKEEELQPQSQQVLQP